MQRNLQYHVTGAAALEEREPFDTADDTAEVSAADAATPADRDAWRAEHAVNLRFTIPLPFTRFYLTVVGGRERRSPDRRAGERRKHPLATKGNIIFLGILGLVTGLALLALIQFAARFALERAGVV